MRKNAAPAVLDVDFPSGEVNIQSDSLTADTADE